jgi:hypothetical protein
LLEAGLGHSCPRGRHAPLRAAKREAVLRLLRAVRAGLDAVPGRGGAWAAGVSPPFHRVSGFPLDSLEGVADRVGVKLYTMHWPMLSRYWARDLIGAAAPARDHDAATAAIAELLGLTDGLVADGATLRYPEPHDAHPVGRAAQRRKLDAAREAAGRVPVVAFAHT